MLKQFSDYDKDYKIYKEVSDIYDSKIAYMKKYFTDDYSKTLPDNTLENIKKIEDKKTLNKAKNNLKKLVGLIKNDKNLILNEAEVKSTIEKLEAEKKAKEEAKRQKELEEQRVPPLTFSPGYRLTGFLVFRLRLQACCIPHSVVLRVVTLF